MFPKNVRGIQVGNAKTIGAMDGEPVTDWQGWVTSISANANQSLSMEYVRDGLPGRVYVTIDERVGEDGSSYGFLGVGPSLVEERYGWLEAVPVSIADTWDKTVLIMSTVKKIVLGDVSVKNLSGPISIAQVAGDSAQYSWRSFLFIMAFLSISLGVFNLLPIPILDGGQIVFHSAELISGKPVPERIQILGVQVGLVLMGTLMIFATYNDFLRLF